MALTFGAAVSNRANFTSNYSFGATTRASLVTGWYRPTTLTAGRRLFAAGAVWGAEIDTTTDELRLRTDNTTDGQWTTAGVDLTVDEWKFVAVANTTNNTGPASAWRVWSGTIETAPVEATVTVATSPVGNFTGTTAFIIGNNSGIASAFQGDIENVSVLTTSAAAGLTTHPLGINAIGTITNTEAQWIYESFVLPLWLGELPAAFGRGMTACDCYNFPLLIGDAVPPASRIYGSATTLFFTGSYFTTGLTASENSGPRPQFMSWASGAAPTLPIRR